MIQVIKKRRSVRTYLKKSLSAEDQLKIESLLEEVKEMKGPFGHSIDLKFFNKPLVGENENVKIGTYGFVKNAQTFISGSVENTFEGLVDFGYLFEYMILRLTKENLGTVWLGGTFNRKDFNYLLNENEIIPAITPVGYIHPNMSIQENVMRSAIKANQRIPFETLFFNKSIETPLDPNHPYSDILELVRLSPSASNKQPWRVIVDGNVLHFYLKKTPKYAESLSFDIQVVDLGIAIQHATQALFAYDMNYHLEILKKPKQLNDLTEILSIVID